ncbi:MAG: hypothetical protein E7400_05410 [Ruminococcaceae bacterium]|nr:hypothetical protein [Oscillospiraceae bacterium]
MQDVREVLNIKIESTYWDEAYKKALSEPEIPEWLTEGFIRKLNDEYDVIPKSFDLLLEALPHVVSVPELCLLAKTLYHILMHKKSYSKAFTCFEFPKAPSAVTNTIGYDCFSIFPILAHLPFSWDELKARGIEDTICRDSLRWVDNYFEGTSRKSGKVAFAESSFPLYSLAIYVYNLYIGRLRFEIHENSVRPMRMFQNQQGELCPLADNAMIHASGHILGTFACEDEAGAYSADFVETEDAYEGYTVDETTRLFTKKRVRLLKSEWKQVFASGDTVVKVHIPFGGKMTKEMCEESYSKAREVFANCYPDYQFAGFQIGCWMLSPELKDILSPESNIIAFQKNYTIYPIENNALDAFLYVYGIEAPKASDVVLADLPEDNSMRRGVKQKSLEGKYVYQFGGYMPL